MGFDSCHFIPTTEPSIGGGGGGGGTLTSVGLSGAEFSFTSNPLIADGTIGITLATNGVAFSKIAQVAANKLVGNPTGATADITTISLPSELAFSAGALVVQSNSIAYSKIQQVSATNKLLGRYNSGAGNIEEIGFGSNISLSSGNITLGSNVTIQGNTFNGANQLLQLDSSGFVPSANIPAIAITNTYTVASQVAMLALTAQTGDVAIRTDVSKSFILQGSNPAVLGDWAELLSPTGAVTSVNASGGTTGLSFTGGPITSSGTLTMSGTLLPANGGTGITSFGTGIATFLGTPSSANLLAAVTDETGTGALVFGTAPTLTTPRITNAGFIADENGNEQIKFTTTASAVNEVTFKNSATGNATEIQATGGDTNVSTKFVPKGTGVFYGVQETFIIAISDETTAITSGTVKATFRMPYAFKVLKVRASLTTSSSSGLPTFDINEGGVSILSTKITIDVLETSSVTALTQPVISDDTLAENAEITIDIDVAGTGATGAKIYIIGYATGQAS